MTNKADRTYNVNIKRLALLTLPTWLRRPLSGALIYAGVLRHRHPEVITARAVESLPVYAHRARASPRHHHPPVHIAKPYRRSFPVSDTVAVLYLYAAQSRVKLIIKCPAQLAHLPVMSQPVTCCAPVCAQLLEQTPQRADPGIYQSPGKRAP